MTRLIQSAMAGVACVALLASCGAIGELFGPRIAATDESATVAVDLELSGTGSAHPGSRALTPNTDPAVTQVLIEAFDTTPASVGTGSLTWDDVNDKWRGTISVSKTGMTNFKAWAKDGEGNQYYYGIAENQNIAPSGSSVTITTSRSVVLASVKALRISPSVCDKSYGSSFVLSEIQVLQNGTAKLLSELSASFSGFSSSGDLSNGSFAKDLGNYAYGGEANKIVITFASAVSGIEGFRIGVTGFSGLGADLMEWTPNTINFERSTDGTNYTALSTLSFVRSDFTAHTAKNLLF